MTTRDEIIAFLSDPVAFSRLADPSDGESWNAAMEDYARPALLQANRPDLLVTQQEAWRRIGSSRLSLLLGPPGTGKTFLMAWMATSYVLELRRHGRDAR